MLTVCLAGLARQTRPADEIIVFWAVGALMGHPPLFGSNFAMQSAVWPRIRGKVSRGLPPVHNDLDISYQIPPEAAVVADPTLRVGASARPLASWHAIGRRLSMARTTFAVEFARERPGRRRRRQWEHDHPR